MPSRADMVLEQVKRTGLGPISEPQDFGLAPLKRVHSPEFVDFIQSAWQRWSALGRSHDMLPLAYQFKSCWTHTHLALTAVHEGHFSPDMNPYPEDFASLREMIATARKTCEQASEDALEQIAGNDMVFTIGDKFRLDFTVQDFLLSFSNPNVYFHSATAYDILRMTGVELGKRDYLGALRLKQAG